MCAENVLGLCKYDDYKDSHIISGETLAVAQLKINNGEYSFTHQGVEGDTSHDLGNESSSSYYHDTNVSRYHHEVSFTLKGNGTSVNAS